MDLIVVAPEHQAEVELAHQLLEAGLGGDVLAFVVELDRASP